MRRNKYGVAPKAQRTSREGIVFDSKAEMQRWEKLRLWQLAGEIRNLRRQVKYDLLINGQSVGTYTPDFVYEKKAFSPGSICTINNMTNDLWTEVIEDVKGKMTTDAALRIKIFEVIHNKDVHIVRG